MDEKEWKREEYETWEDAFSGLSPVIRQQSLRVASYTRVIYIGACAALFFVKSNPEYRARMKGSYSDLAYKCGLYHQLGKSLVPYEYQIFQSDFTEEEIAVYRKYTTDGRELIEHLQEKSLRDKEKRKGIAGKVTVQNIPWLMLREACEQHMEKFDGSGYPHGMKGDEISCIAQIVGVAKELDQLASETKSEDPFNYAYEVLVAKAGTEYSPELIEVLKHVRSKCRTVYNKFVYYTMKLPKTIPLVNKKKGRPMGLEYRPMISEIDGEVVAYEAKPWFSKGIGEFSERESLEELEPMFIRTNLSVDLSMYFLYELCDALYRTENCKLNVKAFLLKLPQSFFTSGSQLEKLNQLFEDQPVPREKIQLLVEQDVLDKANKATITVLERYSRHHISLVIDNFDPNKITIDMIHSIGAKFVRIAPELYLKKETAELIKKLQSEHITVIAGEANTHDAMAWLVACGVAYMGGTITGMAVNENELIREALTRGQVS